MNFYRHSIHYIVNRAQNIVVRYPYYSVTFHEICNGPEGTEELGPLTQMAVFHRILPRDQSRIKILDECTQFKGQHDLFNTVAKYDYYMGGDIRSDEQKILDEAIYYIHYLSCNVESYNEESSRNYEIYLDRILYFMTKYTVTVETLRSILTDAGWNVVDRENGPVVLNPSESSSDDEMDDYYVESDEQNNEFDNSRNEESDVTNEENIWDYVTGSPINEIPANATEEDLSQNLHIESLHEGTNATNEENRWDYVTESHVNEISADANEDYLSEYNPHDIWHEESNLTDEERRWDYITNSHVDEIYAHGNEEYLSERNPYTESYNNPNFTIEENRWDYESGPFRNETFTDVDEEYSSAQNPHIGNWHEEPSIIIPENYSVNQENTYLFDGENSLIEESQSLNELYVTDDIKHSQIRNTAESLVYTERELPSDSVPLIVNEIEELEAQVTVSNMSAAFNSLQLENSIDNITIEPAVLQNDQIDVRIIQEEASTLNFQSHMPISRSSTSPASLYFSFEMNNSLQDFSAYYQNESSINNQSCLLNSTFCQSEIASTETTMNTEESTAENVPCFKESLPEKNTQGSELNFLLRTPSNYNYNKEQEENISDKNQIYEDSDMTDLMSSEACSSNFNQPKYTSSPRTKISANIVNKSSKHGKLIPATDSNVSLGTIEKIEKTISDITGGNSLESSQKSNNSITETSKLYTISSSDITNTSQSNRGFSASNDTQQKCLENKKFSSVDNSISIELVQDTNHKFAENDIINYVSDVTNDVQNIDAHHVLSLDDESANHKDENLYCTLAKAHLENMTSDLAQSSIRKKGLNPPRELLSSKSQSVNKYSLSDCAKETNVLRDRFVPSKSSEDTSNVRFMSILKSEENVGTSKDASNIAGLVNNVEAKPSSPLETPPNSWSPEIMDSGYPNSASAQDITPEYDLSSIAQDHISDSESPSVAEAPRLGVLEPIEVENGDLANNNRDDEGNNMMAVDANDIENLQPLIDVLENDLENENDIYVMQNGFPIWLLRILDMAHDFDMQARQNLRIPDEVAGNCISIIPY